MWRQLVHDKLAFAVEAATERWLEAVTHGVSLAQLSEGRRLGLSFSCAQLRAQPSESRRGAERLGRSGGMGRERCDQGLWSGAQGSRKPQAPPERAGTLRLPRGYP